MIRSRDAAVVWTAFLVLLSLPASLAGSFAVAWGCNHAAEPAWWCTPAFAAAALGPPGLVVLGVCLGTARRNAPAVIAAAVVTVGLAVGAAVVLTWS